SRAEQSGLHGSGRVRQDRARGASSTIATGRRSRGGAEEPKSGQRVRSSDEWIRIAVPAIVSAELFEAAQEQLERNRKFAERNRGKYRYLLAGLTVCAKCG